MLKGLDLFNTDGRSDFKRWVNLCSLISIVDGLHWSKIKTLYILLKSVSQVKLWSLYKCNPKE